MIPEPDNPDDSGDDNPPPHEKPLSLPHEDWTEAVREFLEGQGEDPEGDGPTEEEAA